MCPNQKAHSASITAGPHAYEAEEKKKKGRTIIELDCRGLEFVEFKADVRPPALAFCSQCEYSSPIPVADWLLLFFFQGEWEAQGAESSTSFTGIDLSEGEWYDYDEKTSEEVSIKEVKWSIERA